ncbi:hypothetical protein CLAFUR4_03488 [Fulvia fulva]|nr:hypothetical protein CLAFUR4_03488 [Fulvia fulva]
MSKQEDLRKRQASRSPTGGDKPVIKKPIQTQQPASVISGNHSRQSSININDPRRSNVNSPAGSRRNSISVNTNGINGISTGTKQLHGQNGHASPIGNMGSSGGNTPQTSTAPVAFMSSAAPALPQTENASPDLHASIFKALMSVSDQAAEVAVNKMALKEADIALRKAQREHDALEKQFANFPAIKEQKTSARTNMQKRYDAAQKSFQQARITQERCVGAAATAIVEIQLTGQADLRVVKANAGHISKALPKLVSIEQKLTSLSTRLDDVEQQQSTAPQHTAEQFATLEARVNEDHASIERLQASAPQQPPVTMDPAKLTGLEDRLDDMEGRENDHLGLLEKLVDTKVGAVKKWAEAEFESLLGTTKEVTLAQHANAQTINECLSSQESLRKDFEENVSQGCSREVLETLQQQIDALASKTNNMQPTKQPTPPAAVDPSNPLGMKPFKPVKEVVRELQPPPENPTMEILWPRPPVGVVWDHWIENHIGALQSLNDSNTMRLNNTSTDEIHDAMMRVMREKYNKEYPDLLTWSATVEEVKAAHARDIGQLRADSASLTMRVEAHENAVIQGQQKFAEIDSEYKALCQDVLQLQGAQQHALERALNDATS